MAAQAGAQASAGIGTRLRAAREKKGLTILQTAEKLHVDPRIVESLEAEDFAALGAAVYARGHLRHYAELVGEQAAELQELYSHSTRAAPAQPDLTRISRAPPEPDSGKLAGPAVVVLIVIAAVGTVWWLMSHPAEKPVPSLVQSSAQTSSTAPSEVPEASQSDATEGSSAITAGEQQRSPALTPVPAPGRGSGKVGGSASPSTAGRAASNIGAGSAASMPATGGVGAPRRQSAQASQSAGGQSAAAQNAGLQSAAPQNARAQNAGARSVGAQNAGLQSATAQSAGAQSAGPRSARAQSAVGAPATSGAAAATMQSAPPPAPAAHLASLTTSTAVAPPTTRPKEGQLTLKFSSDSWAEVYDASGQRLFYDVGAASSAHTVKGLAPMRVVLGNGAGVTLEFNGRQTPVPTGTSADGSVHFIINAHGRAVPASNGE
jgi:cytoskeleton protein RodZ